MNVSSTFKLNNGNEIPVIALGSWDSRGDEAYHACLDALSSGYRHIDTAAYRSEEHTSELQSRYFISYAVFDACKAKAEELGKKNGWLLYPLGIAISGKQRTPGGGTDLACMMGRETTLARVKAAIEKLNG